MTAQLRSLFPDLTDFSVTSPQEKRYNCIAWAAGGVNRWWWPSSVSFWPAGVPQEESVSAFIQAFRTLKYEPCNSGSLENGFEKVAIYALSLTVTHMARQLSSGRWTSKIGELEDIEHASPAELEGPRYGTVVQYMRRTVDSPTVA